MRYADRCLGDPDNYRKSVICDGIPEAHWAAGYELTRPERPTPEAEAERLRGRVARLCGRLVDGERMPLREAREAERLAGETSSADELRTMCALLERRVGLMLGKISA